MKMNDKMLSLLEQARLSWPVGRSEISFDLNRFEAIHDCFLLKGEYERNQHVKITDFPDKTGFESFINHAHIPFVGTSESLASCLGYATALQAALTSAARDRRFRVIVAIADNDCTVRFHQIRPGENWISANLEGFEPEAILVFDVPS
jgi:hypothetical protein